MPEAVLRDAPPLRRSIYTRSRCDHRNVILCGRSSSSCDEERMKRREFISLFGSGVVAARVESTAAEESRADRLPHRANVLRRRQRAHALNNGGAID